jgi:PPOX class probable F420-dependent enzyme
VRAALVENARVAHLATADRAAKPHLVPICFALVGERLYSVVDDKPKRNARSMKRLRNIAANPCVAVLVDRWDEDWSRLAWVRLQGDASVGCRRSGVCRRGRGVAREVPSVQRRSLRPRVSPAHPCRDRARDGLASAPVTSRP